MFCGGPEIAEDVAAASRRIQTVADRLKIAAGGGPEQLVRPARVVPTLSLTYAVERSEEPVARNLAEQVDARLD